MQWSSHWAFDVNANAADASSATISVRVRSLTSSASLVLSSLTLLVLRRPTRELREHSVPVANVANYTQSTTVVVRLEDLSAFTRYELWLRAYYTYYALVSSCAATSSVSPAATFVTLEAPPAPVSAFNAWLLERFSEDGSRNGSELLLKWAAPDEDSSPLDGYLVCRALVQHSVSAVFASEAIVWIAASDAPLFKTH